MATTLWFEARGEPTDSVQGVFDTTQHRARLSGKTVCQVIAEPGQFSWYKHNKLKPLDLRKQALLDSVKSKPEILTNKNYQWFFSGTNPYWTKNMICHRLGHLNFCRSKT